MQRRSFVKRLCGVVLAGLAAPRVGMSAAEPVVVVDPAAPFYHPMVGGAYAADQPMFQHYPMVEGFYRPGDTFRVGHRRLITVDK